MPSRLPAVASIPRLAVWIWIGYLVALCVLDGALYAQGPFPASPIPQTGFPPNPPLGRPADWWMPVLIYYLANGALAGAAAFLVYQDRVQAALGRAFFPVLVGALSAAPIVINGVAVPRFPVGPLANAEGMALRQLPVLFLGLALVAWQFRFKHIVLYSLGTTVLELCLMAVLRTPVSLLPIIFITLIRTLSFLAIGGLIAVIMTGQREQQAALQQANAELTRYAATVEQLTLSRERNRLSRELHDTVVHTLSSLAVQLEAAQAYLDVDRETVRTVLEKSFAATHAGLQETRRSIHALRASPLDELGLVVALQQLTAAAAERGRFTVALQLPAPATIFTPEIEQGLYRISQEAIENVVRHANARQVAVTLTLQSHSIQLIIEDDGVGFATDAPIVSGHIGLPGMYERAAVIGGVLTIHSGPARGTRVQLTMGR